MTNLHLTSLAADSGVTAGSDVKKLADFAIAGGQAAMHLNRNTVTGATAPLQMTDGAAGVNGTAVSWYTKPLQAVTIAGAITATIWTRENATANNVAPTIRIERCSANGTPLATIVSETTNHGAGEMATTAGGASDSISVTAANVVDTAIASGERLRITLWIDDAADQGGVGAMATGGQGEAWVNGPVGSQGQAQIAFTESVVPIAELTAAYNFDEASGNALDTSGNGRSFAIAGNMARTSSSGGHTNAGLATTATATEAGPTMFGQTGGRTLMMWVKITADFTGWIFEWHDNTLDTGFWGLLRLSGNMGFRARNAAGTIAHANVAHSVDSAWHHWAGTYDGVNVRTYLDGSLVATVALANGIDTVQPDLIRMFTTAASVTVDDVRVYDGVLTQTEISTLKDTPVASAGASGTLVATLSAQTASMAGTASATGPLAGTLGGVTASFAGTVSPPAQGTLAGTLAAQTASFAATVKASGTLDGTLAAQVASFAATAKDSGPLAGTLSVQTASFAATAKDSGSLSGALAAVTASLNGTGKATGAADGTLSAQTASFVATAKASGPIGGTLSGILSTLTGTVEVASGSGTLNGILGVLVSQFSGQASDAGAVDGTLAAVLSDFTATAEVAGVVAGTLSPPTMLVIGAVEVADRDIIVVIEAAGSPSATIAPGPQSYMVTLDPSLRTGIAVEPSRTIVAAEDTRRTEIGAGNMDSQWRVGSKQFIDFVVTLLDPLGELTLSEVQAIPFKVAVTTTGDTPAPDSTAWIDPSVAPSAAAVGDKFAVTVRHLYTAAATGLHHVWVKFGPTPEEPIYEATTFLVR